MTQQARNAMRRNARWLVDHHLLKLGVLFYEFANADWEMEQADLEKRRKKLAAGPGK